MPVTLPTLTRTDGSAGRLKTDARAIINLAKQIAAGEWNNVVNAVLALLDNVAWLKGLPIRFASASFTLAEDDVLVIIDNSAAIVDVQLTPVTASAASFVLKLRPKATTYTARLVPTGSELIEGVNATLVLPDSNSTSSVGPSYTLVRDTSGNWHVL